MHARNLHGGGYDFGKLVKTLPALAEHVRLNPSGIKTINFADPNAVKLLNAALLGHYYQVKLWDIPSGYLCPPVPGRADYIHHLADLLSQKMDDRGGHKSTQKITGLDIGTGANLIYPIIGAHSYNWEFVATDIDKVALKSAAQIVKRNPVLQNSICLRQQINTKEIFKGVINPQDSFSFTMCNPPFHTSAQAALKGTQRKNQNLHKNKLKRKGKTSLNSKPLGQQQQTKLNFAGQSNELWCPGGELVFIKQMIEESCLFKQNVRWFTTLVSKKDYLNDIYQYLEKFNVDKYQTVNMEQGNKISRFVAWGF